MRSVVSDFLVYAESPPASDDDPWAPFTRMSIDLVRKAQTFILPDSGIVLEDESLRAIADQEAVHLPFKSVVLQYTTCNNAQSEPLIQILDERENVIWGHVWWKGKEGWWYGGSYRLPTSGMVQGGGLKFINPSKELEKDSPLALTESLVAAGWVTAMFLNVLACSNVTYEKHGPSRTQRALMDSKRQKVTPHDYYHVLVIDGRKRGDGPQLARPHGSPREHLRRGHIRRLASGKSTWIAAHTVNAGAVGKVTKDYALRARSVQVRRRRRRADMESLPDAVPAAPKVAVAQSDWLLADPVHCSLAVL
jgi:hypothetical protein